MKTRLGGFFVFIFNVFGVLCGAGIESKILKWRAGRRGMDPKQGSAIYLEGFC
ncbi:TPA: hypothetical protein SI311_003209 [Escherichia coli]|nr:hypothetical protein [Escherichia coli]